MGDKEGPSTTKSKEKKNNTDLKSEIESTNSSTKLDQQNKRELQNYDKESEEIFDEIVPKEQSLGIGVKSQSGKIINLENNQEEKLGDTRKDHIKSPENQVSNTTKSKVMKNNTDFKSEKMVHEGELESTNSSTKFGKQNKRELENYCKESEEIFDESEYVPQVESMDIYSQSQTSDTPSKLKNNQEDKSSATKKDLIVTPESQVTKPIRRKGKTNN